MATPRTSAPSAAPRRSVISRSASRTFPLLAASGGSLITSAAAASLAVALWLTGCSAAYGPAPATAPSGGGSYGAPAAPAATYGGSGGGGYRRARSAPPPAPAAAAEESRAGASPDGPAGDEPAPTQRPGLGTEWGERRHSAVRRVSFERSASQPCAGTALHYNDAAGLSAMIDHDLERGAGMAPLRMGPQGEIGIHVADGGSRALPAARVGDRTYVLGREGGRYSVVLVNHGPRRYEVVASVDGLDVLDGKDASVHKPGYVLGPHSRLRIDGFRTSLSEVAAFRFGRVRDSYAARTGTARNVGVIGVALFCERPLPAPVWPAPVALPPTVDGEGETPDDDEIRRRQGAEPFPGSPFSQPPQ